jgi:hypothetical protein
MPECVYIATIIGLSTVLMIELKAPAPACFEYEVLFCPENSPVSNAITG